jgi:hypothetical protein
MVNQMQISRSLAAFLGLSLGTLLSPLWADSGANHQQRNQNFGVSAGNVNDRSRAFCCGGTAGALLRDSGDGRYALSNNHVFARSDQAAVGEKIIQPGLIDVGCQASKATVIGSLSPYPKLGTNVDAAAALLNSGTMDASGFIEDVGQVSRTVTASIGQSVAKSGRTTGLTTGLVEAVNATVSVQYQRGCGQGQKFVVSYQNQVVTSGGMIAGGDSGSLLVDTSCGAVALLFAGDSTGRAIGNPVGEVLTKLGGAMSKTLSFVTGNTCLLAGATATAGTASSSRGPSQSVVELVRSVLEEHKPELLRGPVIGVGVGRADDNPVEAVIVVYIDRTQGVQPELPAQVRGIRVKRVFTDPFVALPGCGDCGGLESGRCR